MEYLARFSFNSIEAAIEAYALSKHPELLGYFGRTDFESIAADGFYDTTGELTYLCKKYGIRLSEDCNEYLSRSYPDEGAGFKTLESVVMVHQVQEWYGLNYTEAATLASRITGVVDRISLEKQLVKYILDH